MVFNAIVDISDPQNLVTDTRNNVERLHLLWVTGGKFWGLKIKAKVTSMLTSEVEDGQRMSMYDIQVNHSWLLNPVANLGFWRFGDFCHATSFCRNVALAPAHYRFDPTVYTYDTILAFYKNSNGGGCRRRRHDIFGRIGRYSHVIHSCRYSATATSHSLIRDEVMRFSKFKTVAVFAILKLWRYTLVKISFEYMCRFFSQMVSITPHFWWFWEFYPQSIVGHLACFEPLCIKIHGLSLQAMKE